MPRLSFILFALLPVLAGCGHNPVMMNPVIRLSGSGATLMNLDRGREPPPGTLVFGGMEETYRALDDQSGRPGFQWRFLEGGAVTTNAEAWDHTYAALTGRDLRERVSHFGLSFSGAEPSVQILDDIPDRIPGPPAPPALKPDPCCLVVSADWASAWPHGENMDWHLRPEFSQLDAALSRFNVQHPAGSFTPAKVAIIDTYFDFDFNPSLQGMDHAKVLEVPDHTGLGGGQEHGTGTLSILAGSSVDVIWAGKKVGKMHGANPHAHIIPIQGLTGVAQVFSVLGVVDGLQKAQESGADIISLSIGGWPSNQEAEKLNQAYHSGIATFAAAGNYLTCPFLPFTTPSFVVYPAAYPNCVCVPGITAAYKSYSYADSCWGWVRDLSHWSMRGNSEPVWLMRRAVCGYTPNVAWSVMNSNGTGLDGAGTSAATPQVAGAASLWLEHHATEVAGIAPQKEWQRAELIMHAVLQGVEPAGGARPGMEIVDPNLGRGRLQADELLDVAPDRKCLEDGPHDAKRNADWLTLLLSIGYPRGFAAAGKTAAAVHADARGTVETAVRGYFFGARPRAAALGFGSADASLVFALTEALNLEAEQVFARSKPWLEYVAIYHAGTKAEFDALQQRISAPDARAALSRLGSRDASDALRSIVDRLVTAAR